MRVKQHMSSALWLTLIGFGLTTPMAGAQMAAPEDALAVPASPASDLTAKKGRIEVGLSGASLSSGNKSWFDQSLQGHYVLKPGTSVNWQLNHERHYGESGTVGALSWTQDLASDLYGSLGFSAGTASFHTKRRFDLGLYKKWGAEQRWVTGLAYMNSRSGDDVHKDQGLTLSAAYYSGQNWVAEGGLVFNRSNPGSVSGRRGFVAVTMGEEKKHYLVMKIDHGKEAYMPVAALSSPNMPNVAFNSTEFTLEWRQWIREDFGYRVGGQYYRNPYYNRKSLAAGIFLDF